MKIEALPQLSDNYAWLLSDEASGDCAVVDPAEGGVVFRRIEEKGLRLRRILATHHHADHIGGVRELLGLAGGGVEVLCSVYDFERGRVPGATRALADGEAFETAGETARALHVPGHTLGALAYHFPGAAAVFTGDTLFTAGCGRLFEGTPGEMFASLAKIKALPEKTAVHCGHEYTEKNMRFSASLFPKEAAVAQRLKSVLALRGAGRPTVPAPLSVELETNPFLRAADVPTFADYRRRRDRF